MVAGKKAGPLFHEEVMVEGAEEDLSFNIMIPLPTPPGMYMHQSCKAYIYLINISDFYKVVTTL